MKKPIVSSILLILVAAAPAMALDLNIDYDKEYSRKVHSFQWVQPKEFEENPLMHQRIVNAIKHELTNRGLAEVESDPDIYVTYHSSSREEVNIDTTHFGYGYPTTWHSGYYGSMATSATTTVSTWHIGTLVIDAWDGESKNLIWRGIAEDTLSPKPEKMEMIINRAVEKLFKKWDKIKKENAKGK